MSAYPGFNGIKSEEGHSLCLVIWGVRIPHGVDTGGGLWNSQSLKLPWPSIGKHKQTNKQNPYLFSSPVYPREKPEAPWNSCGLPVGKAPKASLWPRLASRSWASKPLSFIVYCPPGGDLIPCQSGQGCSGSQACIASTSQDPFDIFYLLLSLQTHRDPLPVTAIQGLTPLVWMGNGEFSFLEQKSLLIP